MVLPTTITGSYPRPLWFDRSLAGRSFKSALGDSLFREQYLDAVASIIAEQEAAGLDIVTDGDSRFDLTVGGKSWFFYPIERLGGVCGHRDTSRGWMSRHGLRPGKILWEVQEAYQPGVVRERLTRGPLEYAALWQVAQRMTDRPVKFGAICAPALGSADQLPLARADSIKAYAVTGQMRLAAAPDIPTFDEMGLPEGGIETPSWHGLFAPSGTPQEVISKLNAAVAETLADLAVQSRLADISYQIFPREQQTPEALAALQKADAEKWWPIIKASGIEAE
jgi:Tripartite tricarboxylate transporter family receptor